MKPAVYSLGDGLIFGAPGLWGPANTQHMRGARQERFTLGGSCLACRAAKFPKSPGFVASPADNGFDLLRRKNWDGGLSVDEWHLRCRGARDAWTLRLRIRTHARTRSRPLQERRIVVAIHGVRITDAYAVEPMEILNLRLSMPRAFKTGVSDEQKYGAKSFQVRGSTRVG